VPHDFDPFVRTGHVTVRDNWERACEDARTARTSDQARWLLDAIGPRFTSRIVVASGRGSLAAVRAVRAWLLDDVLAGWPDAGRRQLNMLLERLREDLAPMPNSQSRARPTASAQTANGESRQ
jgi:hypothetical protein